MSDDALVTTISTERLVLEPWHESVRPDWLELNADVRVSQWLGIGEPISREAAAAEFDWMIDHYRTHGFGWHSVIERETATWIGAVGLSYLGANPAGLPREDIEIGWWLKPETWGRGIATEAASAAIDDGFTREVTDRIWARHNRRNPASGRIMEKIGMTFVRDGSGVHGVPIRIYELRRDQWLASRDN
ncbi:MAG TPA: GNAT family N-acetyltransferase [Actinomycetota bacterium]|nr:GNAT family N-acetyltransferase [Actinomycetota bacterium]